MNSLSTEEWQLFLIINPPWLKVMLAVGKLLPHIVYVRYFLNTDLVCFAKFVLPQSIEVIKQVGSKLL